MFKVVQKGDFKNTIMFLKNASSKVFLSKLDSFGKKGVEALERATPSDSGETARGWGYKIVKTSSSVSIVWFNDVKVGTVPLAILLQYGHGTRNGGYVEGRDYINPTMRPIFDEMAKDAWTLLTKK